jgi:hypothetical protein
MITFFDYLKLIAEEAVAQAPNPTMGNPAAAGNPNMANPAMGAQANKPWMGPDASRKVGDMNQRPAGNAANDPSNALLKQILGLQYPTFVAELGKNIQDPKFLKFLQMGLEDGKPTDDKIKYQKMAVPCAQLIPTQNEIDVGKSLKYPLSMTKTQTLLQYFQGVPQAPGGPIVTCCGGKYVIDGHHRWSQLYCMNPQCPIECVDMTNLGSPELALKIAQIGAAAQGTFKAASVSGENLITIGEQALKDYVMKNMGASCDRAYQWLMQQQGQNTDVKQFAANTIWQNVQQMQQNNRPISGAPPRGLMPQTGDNANSFMKNLAAGKVNWSPN